jgi:hypothetical protein
MKLYILLVAGFAAGIVGCAEKEQAAPEQAVEIEQAAPVETEAPAIVPEAAAPMVEGWRDSSFLDHMHVHADHLDDLNFALGDGDLERATMSAYWLSRHKTVDGLPPELLPYVEGMRDAARDVEAAEDIMAASAAAQRISAQCQACHAAVGITVE